MLLLPFFGLDFICQIFASINVSMFMCSHLHNLLHPIVLKHVFLVRFFQEGFTPMAVAVQQGHDKVISVLSDYDSLRRRSHMPALHAAVKRDDVATATLLLQGDNDVDALSKVLHWRVCNMESFHDSVELRLLLFSFTLLLIFVSLDSFFFLKYWCWFIVIFLVDGYIDKDILITWIYRQKYINIYMDI